MMLLGLSVSKWAAIRKIISGDEFIKTVLEFNFDNVKLNKESQYQIISTQQISHSIKSTVHYIHKSLSSETKRWAQSRASFQKEQDNMIGHVLLSSAFVTYCGFLEQQNRNKSVAT